MSKTIKDKLTKKEIERLEKIKNKLLKDKKLVKK